MSLFIDLHKVFSIVSFFYYFIPSPLLQSIIKTFFHYHKFTIRQISLSSQELFDYCYIYIGLSFQIFFSTISRISIYLLERVVFTAAQYTTHYILFSNGVLVSIFTCLLVKSYPSLNFRCAIKLILQYSSFLSSLCFIMWTVHQHVLFIIFSYITA